MPETSETINKWALLIGINEYSYAPELNGCVNDALLIAEILLNSFGFPYPNIEMLLDEQATRAGILEAMSRLRDRVDDNSVVVLFFSGHGSQVPDQTDRWPDGLVSTIVPQDSSLESEPKHDIIYDEIREWLTSLTSVTPNVTLIFDTDHAGRLSPKVDSGPPEEIPYVFIGASRMDESVFEGLFEGVPHGEFTYALGQEFVKAGPNTTYRDVFERASVQVLARIQNQHPQIVGESDRLLFGTGRIESIHYVPVSHRSGNELVLAAGAAHGMTAKSQWAIYPFETHQVTSSTPKIGLVEITSVGAIESRAEILSEADKMAIDNRSKAVEEIHNYGEMQLVVDIKVPEEHLNLGENLNKLLLDSELLRRPAPEEKAVMTVQIVDAQSNALEDDTLSHLRTTDEPIWVVVDESQSAVMPVYPAEDSSAMWQVRENLEKLARYRNVLGLWNPNVNSPLYDKIEFILYQRTDDGSWVVAEPDPESGLIVLWEQDQIAFKIVNQHDRPVYVSVVDFGVTGSISLVFPIQGGRECIMPGNSIEVGIRGDQRLELYLPDEYPYVVDPNEDELEWGIETLKLFASTSDVDFDGLLLQDGMRGISSQVGETTALWQIIDRAMTGYGTRDNWPVQSPSDQDWITIERSFALVRDLGV
jgi:hypothetical protein